MVFATTNQAIIVFDRDLRAVAWNELYTKMLGGTRELGRGTTFESIFRAMSKGGEYGAGDSEAFVAERLKMAQAALPLRYERTRPNGTVLDVSWLPLPNGFLAISLADITYLKRTEIAIRESEARAAQALARLRDAVESLADPFYLWDAEERLVVANNAATKVAGGDILTPGVRLEDVLAHRARLGLFPGAIGREDAYVRERLAQIRGATGEPTEVERADGRWLSMRDRRTADGGLVNLIVDITEAKQREAELAAARLAADAANRAKSDFLSRMSHELRTPLNAVIGFAQMLQIDRRDALTAKQREYCQDVESAGRHLLALVNDVLDLARIESGNERLSVERVAAADALAGVGGAMTTIAERAGIELRIDAAADVPDLRADDRRLHQILLNLVSNGIKYNRKGGSVRVSVEVAAGDRVRFVVADTGIGIAADRQKELFEPFHRLGQEHSAVDGTGIGLTICKRLAEAMGGSIGFSSAAGRGSVFWVELPADTSTSAAGAGAAAEASDPPSAETAAHPGGFSLLYVEDNPSNMRLMEHLVSILPRVGLLTASNPRLGLELARAHRPDIILLDLHLPDMSGYEMFEHLKAMPETRDIPVMALSAAAMPNDIRRGLAAGFVRYLTKPIDVKEFLGAIGEYIPLGAAEEETLRPVA
ncbi:MAG: response regulator [Alphaproteobacteria bacterium]|nr:response regulator [Alphaproteobacteria bacterium]